MKKLFSVILLAAAALSAQTMILTSSYISTLKTRAASNSPEWQTLRKSCDTWVQYTPGLPDNLPPIYASLENYSDGRGNGSNAYLLIGTDGNYYEGGEAQTVGMPLALCYLMLKDGDVQPSGWSYTWNGISLTPQQYGILAGMQAVKILNKTTPTFAKMTPAAVPNKWGGLSWRPVEGTSLIPTYHANGLWAGQIFGTIDAIVPNSFTNAPTSAGNNVLYFSSTSFFHVGDQVSGRNIPAGTTVSSINPGVSISLSASVTGSGVASGAMIGDIAAGSSCASPGQAPIFVGWGILPPAAHTAVTFTDIMGPLGTQLNGNTYYVSATCTGPWCGYGGFTLETTVGGGTNVCAVPNQGVDYHGVPVGSGQNYNHNQDQDNEYPDRFFLTAISLLYDWLHPLLNQSVATALNSLASQESTAVKRTFTAGGSAWNVSTNPWADSTATSFGNYPQAILTGYSTLQAQVLDSMDSWTREQLANYYSGNDGQTFTIPSSNYHWGHYSGLGLAGIAAYNDDARGRVWYDYWRNHMHLAIDQPYMARWFGPQGNMMDAWNYQSLSLSNIAMAHISNITAMGDDLIANPSQPYPWVVGLEYYKHNLEPNGNSMLTRGFVEGPGWASSPLYVNQALASALFPVQYLADLENTPLTNEFRSYIQNFITKWGESAGDAYSPFLFWNPNGTQTSWTGEPTVLGNMANPAGGYGHVYMRSDWTSGAVYASFEARPKVFDVGNGKDRYDSAGSMLLQRGDNTLLVNPIAECTRSAPITRVGIGQTQFNNATNCYNYVSSLYLGSGFYQTIQTAGNPSTTSTVDSVARTTNASTGSGAVLHFASTTGVTVGMIAIGTNIPRYAYVLAITSTTVTLNQSVSGAGVGNGATVIFATVDFYGGHYGEAEGGELINNWFYIQPGWNGAYAPVCTGPGSPYVPAASYSVTSGHSTDAFTVTLVSPLTDDWGNGKPVILTWSSGASAPTYYVTGGSGATASFAAGTVYLITNWSGSGGSRTFGLAIAPTNYGTWSGYPTTNLTALTLASAGSGTQYIQGSGCNTGFSIMEAEAHPTRIDLLESTSNYAYARGVNMEAIYQNNPYLAGYKGHTLANQREVLYLLPKLFLVYDRTRNAHWNQQAVNFNSLVDSDGTNPIYLVVNGGHNFHSGMQVVLSNIAGSGCSSLAGTYTITALDGYRLALNGQTSPLGATACTGSATGNIWGHQVVPWHTGSKPSEVTTSGQQAAGMRQWYIEAPAVSIGTIGNTTPVTLTTSTPHMLNTGFTINVAGITGACSGLNGTWRVTVPSTNNASDLSTLTLNGSTACGTGTVGSSTIQKFSGAITTVKPLTPPAVLEDLAYAQGSDATAGGFVYRLEIHDPRNCTTNSTWCQVSNADGADSQNWLTVLDASQSAADTATLTPLTATNADMVQVGTAVVAGFQNAQVAAGNCANGTCAPPAATLPINYSFTQGTNAVNHYLAGMTPGATYYVDTSMPGSVTISNTGSSGAISASANGILSFATQGGVATTGTTISGPLQIKGPTSIQ